MSYKNTILNKLLKDSLSLIQFNSIVENGETFFDSIDLEKELLLSNGFPLYFGKENVYLKTKENNIKDQVFCIVDIETNGSNVKNGQIIEIGAIKFKNNKIIEQYESLVSAQNIPRKIQEITGITNEMLVNAPSIQSVLEEFKTFIEDDVFVAHNISFDYKFVSESLKKYNLGELLNRKLCTIELAKRTIEAKRYGLDYLKEMLEIDTLQQHRALNDASSTVKILEICLNKLPQSVKNTEDLIEFAQKALVKENLQ